MTSFRKKLSKEEKNDMAEAGLEPARPLRTRDFKSRASANSATRPIRCRCELVPVTFESSPRGYIGRTTICSAFAVMKFVVRKRLRRHFGLKKEMLASAIVMNFACDVKHARSSEGWWSYRRTSGILGHFRPTRSAQPAACRDSEDVCSPHN